MRAADREELCVVLLSYDQQIVETETTLVAADVLARDLELVGRKQIHSLDRAFFPYIVERIAAGNRIEILDSDRFAAVGMYDDNADLGFARSILT